MERVYFDKQIFSYLFKSENAGYKKFLSDLYNNKKNFLFCFSHAHILDLKNDKTAIKYKELEFIETLVGDNYLSYHFLKKNTSCYLAKPTEVFKDIEEEEDFSISNTFDELFNNIDLSFATSDQKEQINFAKDLLCNRKIGLDFSKTEDLSTDILLMLGRMFPLGKTSMTLKDWMEHLIGVSKSMEEDKTFYKGIRNIVDKHINNRKFTIEYNSIDFNDNLKNSILQKSFIDYVHGNLNPNGDKQISDYDFYTNAYFTLDLLGISKEPSKSVKFRNVMVDSYHSYYGAFCDYVVSDDQGFLKKTKALYRLLNIQVRVMHIEDFIRYFRVLLNDFNLTVKTFFDLLTYDLKNGLVMSSTPSIQRNRITTRIKPNNIYFGYFNQIDTIMEDNQEFVFLSRATCNYSNFNFYREYEGVVNKAIELFGLDKNCYGQYNWEKENKEINLRTWQGRYWEFDTLTIILEINKGTNKFSMQITTR